MSRRTAAAFAAFAVAAMVIVATAIGGPLVNTPPTLNLPGTITQEATGPSGAAVSYSATADDAEDVIDPTVTCSKLSGDTFALGQTTVNCSATDSGIPPPPLTTNGSFQVIVQDTTPPVLTPGPPPNKTVIVGDTVTYTQPTASDAVGLAGSVNCSHPASFTATASTTVSCSVQDTEGNSSLPWSFGVTVNEPPNAPPVLTVPGPITAEATGAAPP
jgi:hypothetical protein